MKAALSFILLVLIHAHLLAQTSQLSGSVQLRDGEGVIVLVSLPAQSKATYTDADGNFHLSNLTAGKHTLHLSAMGYEPVETSVELKADQTTLLKPIAMLPQTINLSEMVITATRTERNIDEVAVPISLITQEQITQMGSMRLTDLLAEQTGMTIVADHGNGVQLQGFDSEYTLIMINGQPLLGRTSGTLDLDRISVNNVKQIEITKGPSSSLFGSEALAGVINIITTEPTYGLSGQISAKHRTNNTNDLTLGLNASNERFKSSANLNRYSSDGYSLDPSSVSQTAPPFHSYTADASLSLKTGNNSQVKLYGRFYKESQSDLSATEDAAGNEVLLDMAASRSDWLLSPSWHWYFGKKAKITLLHYMMGYNTETDYTYQSDKSSFDYSYFKQYYAKSEVQADLPIGQKQTLTAGGGYIRESVNSTRYEDSDLFQSIYGFVQDEWIPTKKLSVLAGLRFDAHSEYSQQLSPKLAARYQLSDRLKIKASYGMGFKAPDFRQLFLDFTNPTAGYTVLGSSLVKRRMAELEAQGQIDRILIPYENLAQIKAERSASFNLGLELLPVKCTTLKLNAFRNDITNMIDTQPIATKTNNSQVYTYFNIHRVFTQGLELETSTKIQKYLNISAGYQYLIAKDKSVLDDIKDGKVYKRSASGTVEHVTTSAYGGLFNRSRHMANAKIFYTNTKYGFNINLRAVYRGRFGFGDANSNTILDDDSEYADGYTTFHLAATKYLLDKKLSLQAGADNLLGVTNSYVPTLPGRLLWASFTYQFQKNQD